MANGQVKYKGTKGPVLTGFRKRWSKGKGWESYGFYKGADAEIEGRILAMQAYCSEIEVESNGPYTQLIGHYGSFNEGEINETPDVVWELDSGGLSTSILNGDTAARMETAFEGTIAIVKRAYYDFMQTAKPGDKPDPDWTKAGIPILIQPLADDLLNFLINQNDSIKVCQPVLSKRQTVTEGDPNYVHPTTPERLLVYESTSLLLNAIGPLPSTVLFSMPAGMWLEYPPKVQQGSYDKFSISQQWEFANKWEEFHYPNRVKTV